jgi:DNA polymerase III sliding clamp (beta) subunit (PCNA family)
MGVMIEKGLLKATDGHRGAQTIGTAFWPNDMRLFLPTVICDSVVSIASKGFESIELSEKDKFGVIRGETSKGSIRSFEISFCLAGENFPDLDKVVPSDIKHEFSVDIKLLSNVLSKLTKLAEKPEKGLMFRADDGSNMLTISVDQSSGETIESEVAIDSINVTSRIVFCLNPSYVIDAIKIPGAETVRVRIVDAMAPVLFENEEFRSIVMPIRL